MKKTLLLCVMASFFIPYSAFASYTNCTYDPSLSPEARVAAYYVCVKAYAKNNPPPKLRIGVK